MASPLLPQSCKLKLEPRLWIYGIGKEKMKNALRGSSFLALHCFLSPFEEHSSQPKKFSKPFTLAASSSKLVRPNISNVLGRDGRLLPKEEQLLPKDHFFDPSCGLPAKVCAIDLESDIADENRALAPPPAALTDPRVFLALCQYGFY